MPWCDPPMWGSAAPGSCSARNSAALPPCGSPRAERLCASWIWLCRSKKPLSSPRNSSKVLVRGIPGTHRDRDIRALLVKASMVQKSLLDPHTGITNTPSTWTVQYSRHKISIRSVCLHTCRASYSGKMCTVLFRPHQAFHVSPPHEVLNMQVYTAEGHEDPSHLGHHPR